MCDYVTRYFGWLVQSGGDYYYTRLLEGLECAANTGDWYFEFKRACEYGLLIHYYERLMIEDEIRVQDTNGGYFLIKKWKIERIKK